VCVAFAASLFAGCTPTPTADSSESAAAEAATSEEPPASSEVATETESGTGLIKIVPEGDIVVGISTGSGGYSWRDIMVDSMKAVGDEYKAAGIIKDYQIVNNTTNGDANEQAQIIRNFVDDPAINVILVNPNDNTALTEPIAEAQKAGKLVVVFDASADSPGTLQVTLDHYAWATRNVEFICETLQEGNVIDIYGLEGHPANAAREQAVKDVLQRYPNINLIQSQSGKWNQIDSKQVTAQIIAGGQQIDGVITQDGMAFGVLSAFLDAGQLPKVMFGDPGTAFFKLWKDLRSENADFKACAQPNPPGIGGTAFRLAISLAQGKDFKDGVLKDNIYYYTVSSFYTDDNFEEGWELLKDLPDDYYLSETISQPDTDALFK
jgi:ribose transport system substrate-binding protein